MAGGPESDGSAQRDDACGRVGDAGERAGCEANQAAQLVSQKRVKMLWNIFRTSRNMGQLPYGGLSIHKRIAILERDLESANRKLEWANLTIQKREAQIRLLEERLRQRRIQVLGPHSETLSDLQLELLAEVEPSATREEVEAESRREPLPQKPPRERKPHPGRKPLPENLPRIEQVIACTDANCKTCGAETSVIGYDESEVLDHEPARWFVRVTKREKRACGKCSTHRHARACAAHCRKGSGE